MGRPLLTSMARSARRRGLLPADGLGRGAGRRRQIFEQLAGDIDPREAERQAAAEAKAARARTFGMIARRFLADCDHLRPGRHIESTLRPVIAEWEDRPIATSGDATRSNWSTASRRTGALRRDEGASMDQPGVQLDARERRDRGIAYRWHEGAGAGCSRASARSRTTRCGASGSPAMQRPFPVWTIRAAAAVDRLPPDGIGDAAMVGRRLRGEDYRHSRRSVQDRQAALDPAVAAGVR